MGIAVQELLTLDFFSDCFIVAGQRGIYKEIQGVTVVDAPDAYDWAKGRELVLSSGYVIDRDPECLLRAFEKGTVQVTSGLMIKRDRYLDTIPDDIIRLFDEHEIPLISMPAALPYMEVMNQINIAIMNRAIRRFRIYGGDNLQVSNQSYKEQKIKRILQAVEVEMKFPAFLYDLSERKGYVSSANFKRITQSFGLTEEDYWNPSRKYAEYVLCDYIHMSRYRLFNPDNMEGPRVSWILIPISTNGVTQAYFVVMESREFLDHYDEYSIRIAFLLLQAVYEQIMVTQSLGNIGFENFVHLILNSSDTDHAKIAYQAGVQGISISTNYICVMFRQTNEEENARRCRKEFIGAFHKASPQSGQMIFLDENEGLLLLETDGEQLAERSAVEAVIDVFENSVRAQFENMHFEYGICREETPLEAVRTCVEKCRNVMHMGRILYSDRSRWDYEDLGPLSWLQIPPQELQNMLSEYQKFLVSEKNNELIRTLKIYLENNMNYSATAEKLYLHINTIRKRIDKIDSIFHINWDNPVERLKTQILLQFLDMDE